MALAATPEEKSVAEEAISKLKGATKAPTVEERTKTTSPERNLRRS